MPNSDVDVEIRGPADSPLQQALDRGRGGWWTMAYLPGAGQQGPDWLTRKYYGLGLTVGMECVSFLFGVLLVGLLP